MESLYKLIRSPKCDDVYIQYLTGHFATRNSHLNTYMDHTAIKTQYVNARATGYLLADLYKSDTAIDAIVCLKKTEVVASFMAESLSTSPDSLSKGKNIAIITPEFDTQGLMFFRENRLPFLSYKKVLVLIDSMNSGIMTGQAVESIKYYTGIPCGVCGVFAAVDEVAGFQVRSLFGTQDFPNYLAYPSQGCELCKSGDKVMGIINSYGFAKL